MYGKILKISNNDLYGNADERTVSLFATFIHKKYMNKYAIFTFSNEFNKNKLYYASIHLKENSIVTFSVKDDEIAYINKFVSDYLNNTIDQNEYAIIDVSNISKIELVSNTVVDFDRLIELDNLSIPKPKVTEEVAISKKPTFLIFLLIIFILLLVAVIYLHYNPEVLDKKLNKLECTKESYDKKVDLPYRSVAELRFDSNNELDSVDKIDTYTFNDIETYNEFKDNHQESSYFDISGGYKYDDNDMTLKLIYKDKMIIYEYNEILKYMKKEGYSCVEGVYNG